MRRTSVLLALTALLVAASVAHAAGLGKVVDKATAHGAFAAPVASGTVDFPAAMYVKVTANPGQNVTGNYAVICYDEAGTSKSRQQDFRGRTPLTVKIKPPFTGASFCSIGAAGQLDKRGALTVTIFGRSR